MIDFTRRDFLKAAGGLSATAALGAVLGQGGQDIVDIHAAVAGFETAAKEEIIPSVCLMCPSGCGLWARVVNGRLVKLEGSPLHPINQGALCPKGQAAPELLYNPDRIPRPLRRVGARGAGEWEPIDWENALSLVTQQLSQLRDDRHPERFAFLYGETRGQMRDLITYFTNVFGSPNAVSHDSLNIEGAKLAHLLTQGIHDLMAYDLENTNYILSFGASLLEAGRTVQRFAAGHAYLRRGRPERGKVVMIDPRQGINGAKADEWIPIKPGTDAALALGIAHVLISSNMVDQDFVQNYAFGYEDWEDLAGIKHMGFKSLVLDRYDLDTVSTITGVPAGVIARLAGEFASNRPSVSVMPCKGGLLNGSINGLYAGMAIHALNALVGNIETPGGVQVQRYLACRGWPQLPTNAITEQGLLFERVDGAGTVFPVARHAYQAVADRLLEGYPIDILFLYDANPMFECPNGGARWETALDNVEFIVSFSSFMDETTQYADLILPDHTFLERWQDDHIEGLGYPGIAIRQPVVEPVYDTRHAGDVLINLARRLGGWIGEAFPWSGFQSLLKEQLQDVGTSWETLTDLGLWIEPPYTYAKRGSDPWINEVVGRDRQHAPKDGYFDFFSRELYCLIQGLDEERLVNMGIKARGDVIFLPHYEPVNYHHDEDEYPFVLNVITLMSLGSYSANANLPTLQEISGMTVGETWDSWLEMNPESAHDLDLHDKDPVWVESNFGKVKTKVKLVPGVRPDVVNMPYNQGHRAVGRWAKDRGANGLELMGPNTEPVTGLAAFTNTRVKVYRA